MKTDVDKNFKMKKNTAGAAIPTAALILGIISVIFSVIPSVNFIAPFTGIIGVILGVIAVKSQKYYGKLNDMAIDGLAASIIGTIIGIISFSFFTVCAGTSGEKTKSQLKEEFSKEKIYETNEPGSSNDNPFSPEEMRKMENKLKAMDELRN
ncbi:MAG: DUF4190 domain-containing protein [bacterium]|nr:DUF4190 domain-containing protein [bacterium]